MNKKYLMKCGCVSNATCEGRPACAIHSCTEIEREVQGTDGLEGRMSKCSDCRRTANSNWTLPFFKYQPDKETDEHYCGCRGWD